MNGFRRGALARQARQDAATTGASGGQPGWVDGREAGNVGCPRHASVPPVGRDEA